MPGWVQAILAIAAALTALGVIWQKGIKPLAKAISQAEKTLPVLDRLVKEWAGADALPSVLREISEEFQSNHGSTLKDALNRLEAAVAEAVSAAEENNRAAMVLNRQFEIERALTARDREVMDRLVTLVNILDARMKVGVQGVADIKDEQTGVARDLVHAQGRVDGVANALVLSDERVAAVARDLKVSKEVVAAVAEDLRLAHERANEQEDADPGEAADAAAKGPA